MKMNSGIPINYITKCDLTGGINVEENLNKMIKVVFHSFLEQIKMFYAFLFQHHRSLIIALQPNVLFQIKEYIQLGLKATQ